MSAQMNAGFRKVAKPFQAPVESITFSSEPILTKILADVTKSELVMESVESVIPTTIPKGTEVRREAFSVTAPEVDDKNRLMSHVISGMVDVLADPKNAGEYVGIHQVKSTGEEPVEDDMIRYTFEFTYVTNA